MLTRSINSQYFSIMDIDVRSALDRCTSAFGLFQLRFPHYYPIKAFLLIPVYCLGYVYGCTGYWLTSNAQRVPAHVSKKNTYLFIKCKLKNNLFPKRTLSRGPITKFAIIACLIGTCLKLLYGTYCTYCDGWRMWVF